MNISEHKGFQIQIHQEQERFYAEIYRKENLLYTIRESTETGGSFRSGAAALESAKLLIDRNYPKGRINYLGEV